MKQYETLNHEILDLDNLPKKHQNFYREINKYYKKGPDWNEFSNLWRGKINSIFHKVKREDCKDSYFQDLSGYGVKTWN